MKFALGAVALALAAPVFAQSSVNIYGVIDVNGSYTKGHSSLIRENSGGLNGSRLGFKGSEDLGDGYKANFVLEAGINVDTGSSAQGGTLFGRQAYGEIVTPTYGKFSAGRQYSSIYWATDGFSETGANPTGPSPFVIGGYGGYEPVRGNSGATPATQPGYGSSLNGGPVRVNNSFRYTSPTYAGVTGSVLYGAGEVTGQTNQDRLWDGSIRYTNYGVDALVSYVDDRAQGSSLANTADFATLTLAAQYAWDAYHVEGGYLHVNDKRSGLATGTAADGEGFWLGGDYRMGNHLFKTQWVQNKQTHLSDSTTNAYGLGYQYDFTKRTALYSWLTRFQNGSNAGGGLGRYNTSIPTGLTTVGDDNLTEFTVGFRHFF